MSKRAKIIIGVVVGVVVIGGLTMANLKKNGEGKASEVRLEKVEKKTLVSTVRSPGRVRPAEYVNLSAQVPGRIIELAVEEGDTVRAGDLLIRLDDTQYRADMENARAAARSAEANVALSSARVDRSRQNLDRQKKMKENKLVSEEAIEIAETELKIAESELAARKEDLAGAKARIRSSDDALSKTIFGGIVSALNVKEGEIVITGTMNNPGTVILTIADQSKMQVEAEVDETDVIDIHPGQVAKITVDALPDTTFIGSVTTIGSSAQQTGTGSTEAATNFLVKVLFDQDIPQLRPGMTADVEITTMTRTDVLAVPISSLVARDKKTIERQKKTHEEMAAGGGKAMANNKKGESEEDDESTRTAGNEKLLEGIFVNDGGKAIFHTVKTGISDDTHIEVTGDLAVGADIVTGPYKTSRPPRRAATRRRSW
ncbi:MAG: HlyD family secretion protein [bacterium]|nr:MAG: HlyD family secretion protein [bacterium]